jgi:hypothetical protein
MEGLAPPLRCLIEIHSGLQNGEPVRAGLSKYLAVADAKDEFAPAVRAFLFAFDHGNDWKTVLNDTSAVKSPFRRTLLEIVACGLKGQSIMAQLQDLQDDIANACDSEIKEHLEILPIKMLIPLLLFQFPAFLLLLFGPLLKSLIEELNR